MLPWLLLMTVCTSMISVVRQIQKMQPEESNGVLGYSLVLISVLFSWLMMRPMRITATKVTLKIRSPEIRLRKIRR